MTFIEVAQLDLAAMTKTELKNYAKKARAIWGEAIDLRKATVIDLQQYLENYQAWAARIASIAEQMEETEETAVEEPATDIQTTEAYRGCGIYIAEDEGVFTARVRDLDSEIDITVEAPTKEQVREQAIAAIDSAFDALIEAEVATLDLPDFENGEANVTTLADFEGITDAPLGDWWMSCPLTCDSCNYHACQMPNTKEKALEAACIHDRALLMARAEGEALCNSPQLGQDIYWLWVGENRRFVSPGAAL